MNPSKEGRTPVMLGGSENGMGTRAEELPFRYTQGRFLAIAEVVAMSLVEVLPEVRSLSRLDKLRLIQLFAPELECAAAAPIEPGQSYPVWSPDRAFTAAPALLQALDEDKGRQ